MLIEHLEAHYPACMRQLWDHISRGGLFADHLPVNDMMALEGVYNFIIREWNQVLSSLLPDGSKRTSGENRWIQLLEQWLWDTKDELDHLLLAGWDGPSLLRGLLARAGLRGCPPYGLIVQNMVSRLSSELCIGEGPTAPLTHAAWAVTTETRLYALCVQHGGTTATTDSSTRGISTASGSASSSSNPVPIATNFTGLEGPLISEGIQMLGPGPDAHSDINDVGFENEDPPTSEDTQTLGVRPDTHSDIKDVDIENEDAVSLMANKGVNKRWLKSRSRSRCQRSSRHRPAREPVEPSEPPPRRPPARVTETRESVDFILVEALSGPCRPRWSGRRATYSPRCHTALAPVARYH